MLITVLGCGTSTGVPMIHCECSVCRSPDPKNNRLRASVWIQTKERSFLIDTTPDLRAQALREGIQKIDAVLYTHPHADHLHGIDELRSYNFVQKKPIPVFGNRWTAQEIRERFAYVLGSGKNEGGGSPSLDLHEFDSRVTQIDVFGTPVTPVSLIHGSQETIAYRMNTFAYVTDCNEIPPQSQKRLQGLEVLILDCVRLASHPTHLNFEKALEMIETLQPKQTYLTHLNHEFDYAIWSKKLPKHIALAYDGLQIRV
jgi:phosphoribosyl 1,2-cyclic phosphate phosphodiesterase